MVYVIAMGSKDAQHCEREGSHKRVINVSHTAATLWVLWQPPHRHHLLPQCDLQSSQTLGESSFYFTQRSPLF